MRRAAYLLAWLGPALASASPADVQLQLKVDAPFTQRFGSLEWAGSDDPKLVSAEVLPTGELLLEAHHPGVAHVMLIAQGRVAVWQVNAMPSSARLSDVRADAKSPHPLANENGHGPGHGYESESVSGHVDVSRTPSNAPGDSELAVARKACPGLVVSTQGDSVPPEKHLVVTVKDEPCRQALRALFQTDAFTAHQLELTFELPALQAQLTSVQKALASALGTDLHARYVGAGLVLEGELDEARHHQALWIVFNQVIGGLALDDRVTQPSADAGSEAR